MARTITIERRWARSAVVESTVLAPRADLVIERAAGDGRFELEYGPFIEYERLASTAGDEIVESTRYRLDIPWFGWVFALLVRRLIGRGGRYHPRHGPPSNPSWAPPAGVDARQAKVLGLLAAAAMASAFTNTLFTQTATFAADSFGVGDAGVGWAGAIVRVGVIIALPFAFAADRIGRRRVVRVVVWAAPLACALGAFAPTFEVLVATQSIGRPLGLAIDLLIAVVAAEEMSRHGRAYAVSVLAMASGLGAGVAVWALPLADIGTEGWRLVYIVSLVWLLPAWSIVRHLPETTRFERPHVVRPPIDRRRLLVVAAVVIFANAFVAPASFFQNRYLSDVRELSASMISVFTLTTATPAALGLIVGGRLADRRGRRLMIAAALPVATMLVLVSFYVDGYAMWAAAFGGGLVGGIAYPALAVYRAELFPTGNRAKANGLLATAALIGGSAGILLVGQFVGSGIGYGPILTIMAVGQLLAVLMVLWQFPESAHRELEDLNDIDAPLRAPAR